jgi:hypothetical protein
MESPTTSDPVMTAVEIINPKMISTVWPLRLDNSLKAKFGKNLRKFIYLRGNYIIPFRNPIKTNCINEIYIFLFSPAAQAHPRTIIS